MLDNFLIAEGYGQLLCQFAAETIPGYVPSVTSSNSATADPLRPRSIRHYAATIEQLMRVETEIPIEWSLGEYWTSHTSDLATSRALNSATVREALEVSQQNQLLLSNVRSIKHSPFDNDCMMVKYHSESACDNIVIFLSQSLAASTTCHVIKHVLPEDTFLDLDRKAESFESLMNRFGRNLDLMNVDFRNTELSLIFHRDILERKVVDADRRLTKAIDCELHRRAADVAGTGRWKDRIKRHMLANSLVDVSLDEICDLFAVQRRTLSRQLQKEGTSFTEILRELRRDRALHLVRYTRLPLKRIAAELGFNSDASFNLAFKSWTGTAPMKFRKSLPPTQELRPN